jgi:cell division protein FtsI (penicillin-binding protein 3)
MSLINQRKAHRRISMMAFLFMLWLIFLIIRLLQLQVIEHPNLKTIVTQHNQNKKDIIPKRGTIYDRTGIILARSLPFRSVFYTSNEDEPLESQLEKIQTVKSILNLSDWEFQRIKKRIKKTESFIWIKRKIPTEKEEKIKKLSLNGIYFLEENKRYYPHGKRAAHLLGRVDIDEVGASGIEYSSNSVLAGVKGEHLIMKDAKKREYEFETLKEPEDGKDLVLTIDEAIQFYAEKELEKAVLESGAKWGSVIIAHPSSGEILAMANFPAYNLNNLPPSLTVVDRNNAIHHNFEPGSTFKIVTASAALETNKVSLADSFDCSQGYVSVAGKLIRDHQRYGILTFPEVIIHSSNVGIVQLSHNLDRVSFYEIIKNFGFGKKTGINLPAEEKGIFRQVKNWSRISPASLSIGYEISVTALQMLQAVNIIANEGVLVPPMIVRRVLDSSSQSIKNPLPPKRIISRETALILTSILQEVVQGGTGSPARITGYSIAGKTGTAQIFDSSTGSYSSEAHIASFVGFVPANNPAFSMIVVIGEPTGSYYGGEVAGPIFREISKQVLQYLKIPRQKTPQRNIMAKNRWRLNN